MSCDIEQWISEAKNLRVSNYGVNDEVIMIFMNHLIIPRTKLLHLLKRDLLQTHFRSNFDKNILYFFFPKITLLLILLMIDFLAQLV